MIVRIQRVRASLRHNPVLQGRRALLDVAYVERVPRHISLPLAVIHHCAIDIIRSKVEAVAIQLRVADAVL